MTTNREYFDESLELKEHLLEAFKELNSRKDATIEDVILGLLN